MINIILNIIGILFSMTIEEEKKPEPVKKGRWVDYYTYEVDVERIEK